MPWHLKMSQVVKVTRTAAKIILITTSLTAVVLVLVLFQRFFLGDRIDALLHSCVMILHSDKEAQPINMGYAEPCILMLFKGEGSTHIHTHILTHRCIKLSVLSPVKSSFNYSGKGDLRV